MKKLFRSIIDYLLRNEYRPLELCPQSQRFLLRALLEKEAKNGHKS